MEFITHRKDAKSAEGKSFLLSGRERRPDKEE
jgi:hypothetical protein